MWYTDRYDDQITMKYGVELRGWPLAKLKNPSNITALGDLERVSKALKDGGCGWVRLRNDELAVRRKVLEQEVQQGERAALKWMGAAGASSSVSAGRKRKRNCQDSAVGKRGGGQSNSVVSDEDDEEPEQ